MRRHTRALRGFALFSSRSTTPAFFSSRYRLLSNTASSSNVSTNRTIIAPDSAWQPSSHLPPSHTNSSAATRTLLITSRLDSHATAAAPRLQFTLTNARIQAFSYTLTTHLPTVQQVQEAVDMYRRTGAGTITVLGSGAAIDLAKGVRETLLKGTNASPATFAAIPPPTTAAKISTNIHSSVNYQAGAVQIPLTVIPTSLSPVAGYSRWACLHPEDDALVSYRSLDSMLPPVTGAGSNASNSAVGNSSVSSSSSTTVIHDTDFLAAAPSQISCRVTTAYLLSNLLDGLMAHGARRRANTSTSSKHGADSDVEGSELRAALDSFPFASLKSLLIPSVAAATSKDASLHEIESACQVAAAVSSLRNVLQSSSVSSSSGIDSSSMMATLTCPSAMPLEAIAQLALFASTNAAADAASSSNKPGSSSSSGHTGSSNTRLAPYSWTAVETLGPVLRAIEMEGGLAQGSSASQSATASTTATTDSDADAFKAFLSASSPRALTPSAEAESLMEKEDARNTSFALTALATLRLVSARLGTPQEALIAACIEAGSEVREWRRRKSGTTGGSGSVGGGGGTRGLSVASMVEGLVTVQREEEERAWAVLKARAAAARLQINGVTTRSSDGSPRGGSPGGITNVAARTSRSTQQGSSPAESGGIAAQALLEQQDVEAQEEAGPSERRALLESAWFLGCARAALEG